MINEIYLIYKWYNADGPLDHSSDAGYQPIGYAKNEEIAKKILLENGRDCKYEKIGEIQDPNIYENLQDVINPTQELK